MLKPQIKIGNRIISEDSPAFVIAELGHNHQGDINVAKKLIDQAAYCGADAVKLQKRFNKGVFTKEFYNSPYDHEDSFGKTYGEHREFLEFGKDEYLELREYAWRRKLIFFATAFDFESADFLEEIGVPAFKIASFDIDNHPLIEYIAKKGKPVFISTGGATLEEVRQAYKILKKYIDQICIMQCTSCYPAEYHELNLNVIKTYKRGFPDAIIGYSGHDNSIAMPEAAYILGAKVIEKHLTLCHAMKGTDHKFSLEPTGLRKLVRDLRRFDISLGNGEKIFYNSEKAAKRKMGKSIVFKKPVAKGTILTADLLAFKSPADGISPSKLNEVIGKKIIQDLAEDSFLLSEHLGGGENLRKAAFLSSEPKQSFTFPILAQSITETDIRKEKEVGEEKEKTPPPLQLEEEEKSIKFVVFDFDGVFTDNHVYTSQDGIEWIKCWRGDGLGLAKLKKAGIQILVLSAEENPVVEKRCAKLQIECITGCQDKISALKKELEKRNILPQNTCYVGNDINDLECLKYVCFPVAVSDSYPEVLEIAHYITKRPGGFGAVREICDLIYSVHQKTQYD